MVTKDTWEFATSLRNTESIFNTLLGSFLTRYNHFLSLEDCQEAHATKPSKCAHSCHLLSHHRWALNEWMTMNFFFCPSRCLSWVNEHWTNSLIKLGWGEILNTEEEENQFNSTKHDLSIMVFNFTPQYKTQTVVICFLNSSYVSHCDLQPPLL